MQSILVNMFRELIEFCVRTIYFSGYSSLLVQHKPTATYIILCFWSENVFRVCIGGAPRVMLLSWKIFSLVSSFRSLFEAILNCVSLIHFGDKLNVCLPSCLRGLKPPSIVNSFGPNESEPLAVPNRADF